ncbi:MAG TPA: 16S rRNA (cytidine(1402)-2'-O)-methyltransferase, partial [Micavibrio sp.]
KGTLVAYETAPRLIDSLKDMALVLGDRPAAVVRELTKMYEEVRRGDLSALAAHYAGTAEPKGEIVVVIGPPEKKAFSDDDIETLLRQALENMSVKDATAQVAERTGAAKKKIYELALKAREGR